MKGADERGVKCIPFGDISVASRMDGGRHNI